MDSHRHQLITRFGNAAVKDTVPRLCTESSDSLRNILGDTPQTPTDEVAHRAAGKPSHGFFSSGDLPVD